MSLFERASKLKLRFPTNKGILSTEDLWDLSLESLDVIAKAINKQLKADSEESFIGKKSASSSAIELSLEILKHIIAVKLAEKEAKANRAAKAAKVAQLKEIIGKKSLTDLENKSTDDLLKELEALEAEE
jgi:hypothetical protein